MQVKNKKQLLITLLSVLVSVFLVVGAVMATTTIGLDISNDSTTETTGIDLTGTYSTAGLQIGTSGDEMVLDNSNHAISVFTEHSATSGTVRSAEITQTMLVAGPSTIQEALYVDIESAVTTGNWTNAIVGRINYTAPGKADGGMAAAICGEMSLPGAAQTGGAYYAIDAEIEAPASFVIGGNPTALPVAFLKFGVWGDATAIDSFESAGYLFHLDGVADTAGGLFDATNVDDPDFTHALKINIGGTEYFIGLSTAVGFGD